jgi:hypothetical protein
MDILYYSNYCKHSQKVLNYLVKGNMTDSLSFICVDKRERDKQNNQLYIILENGKRVMMPPHVHSVPALLQVKNNYNVILGNDIITLFQPMVEKKTEVAQRLGGGEPAAFQLAASNNGMNIVSEKYTYYNASPDELSAKGNGTSRQMYNYVPATHDTIVINTPPDNYRPDKVDSDITVDGLQQTRNNEIKTLSAPLI